MTISGRDPRIGAILPRTAPHAARGARSRGPRGPAHPAGAVADALGVADRGEHDPVRLGDPLLVDAAATADDPRARAAREHGRRALELNELRLHRSAERVVTPRAVTADDAVTGNDHRHRIGA